MATNAQLQNDVCAELSWDPCVHDKEIGVLAADGVVTLTGTVPSYAHKLAAEHAAERVTGVKAVANEIEVTLTPMGQRTDADLARAVADALSWDVQVAHAQIKAAVTNGWITLAGDVEWRYERDAALRAVQYLTGVRGVTDNITISPRRVSAYDVSRDIRQALERQADRTARQIHVETSGSVVTLSGTVPTFADRLAAERAAWSATGVSEVRDELAVAS
jgi:VCBS repeat-containing protein